MISEYEKKYSEEFTKWLGNGKKSGSYQHVLLKSFLYLPERIDGQKRQWGQQWIHGNGDKIEVDFNFLAVPFTKFYWEMYYKYRLRQSQTKNGSGDYEDINIRETLEKDNLKKMNLEEKPPTMKQLAGQKYFELRKKVIEKSMKKEVFHAKGVQGFWEKNTNRKNKFVFDKKFIDYLEENRKIWFDAINYELVLYLQKINRGRPLAHTVLLKFKRGNLPAHELREWKELYVKPGQFECFYCGCEFKVQKKMPARDHVIPFAFVGTDELYNSVPACTKCNGEKSDALPDEDRFEKVIKRNKTIKNKENYTEEEFRQSYCDCERKYHIGDKFRFQKRDCP